MPPNFNDASNISEPANVVEVTKENGKSTAEPADSSSDYAALKAVRSLTTLVAHILIGIITGVTLIFGFHNGLPMNVTYSHAIISVIGYQFLMAEAILCLAPDSWLSTLSLKHKRWVHWILQIVGSVLALVGCFLKILDKSNHWNSMHGKYGLVAMVFTVASVFNGITSMYAYEFQRVMPGILSKLTHICFGIIAMVAASISLAYGFHKGFFRSWASDMMTDSLIIMTGAFTTIVVINPFLTFFKKLPGAFKK